MIVGIIPARANSKGLPNKNILHLGGKPLIQHTFESAKESRLLDHILLTTDMPEAMDLARDLGGIEVPFTRPKHLCSDSASVVDVVAHVLDFLKARGDEVKGFVILQPTSPFSTAREIDKGIDILLKGTNSVLGVCEVMNHPADYVIKNKKGKLEFLMPRYKGKQRQEFPNVYFNNGSFYACRVEFFNNENVFYDENTVLLIMNRKTIIDIDESFDLKIAESLLKS